MVEILEKLDDDTRWQMTQTASSFIEEMEKKYTRTQQALILKHICETFEDVTGIDPRKVRMVMK